MDPMKLRNLLQAKMSSAQTPYDSVSGGVYLQRAWERGAAYAIEQCLEVVATERIDLTESRRATSPSPASRAEPLPAWQTFWRRAWPFFGLGSSASAS